MRVPDRWRSTMLDRMRRVCSSAFVSSPIWSTDLPGRLAHLHRSHSARSTTRAGTVIGSSSTTLFPRSGGSTSSGIQRRWNIRRPTSSCLVTATRTSAGRRWADRPDGPPAVSTRCATCACAQGCSRSALSVSRPVEVRRSGSPAPRQTSRQQKAHTDPGKTVPRTVLFCHCPNRTARGTLLP
jgi:hypothetical protein